MKIEFITASILSKFARISDPVDMQMSHNLIDRQNGRITGALPFMLLPYPRGALLADASRERQPVAIERLPVLVEEWGEERIVPPAPRALPLRHPLHLGRLTVYGGRRREREVVPKHLCREGDTPSKTFGLLELLPYRQSFPAWRYQGKSRFPILTSAMARVAETLYTSAPLKVRQRFADHFGTTSQSNRIPVFVVIGVGGSPKKSENDVLYPSQRRKISRNISERL